VLLCECSSGEVNRRSQVPPPHLSRSGKDCRLQHYPAKGIPLRGGERVAKGWQLDRLHSLGATPLLCSTREARRQWSRRCMTCEMSVNVDMLTDGKAYREIKGGRPVVLYLM
jgi:hypothetical protein